MQPEEHHHLPAQVLSQLKHPIGISILTWNEGDFAAIQRLSSAEGWPTPERRPADALAGWHASWPTLVAIETETGQVVGFVRAMTDGSITLYVMELLVDPAYRGKGIGRALLDTSHLLYPRARIEVMSIETSQSFYMAHGFRVVGPGLRKSYV